MCCVSGWLQNEQLWGRGVFGAYVPGCRACIRLGSASLRVRGPRRPAPNAAALPNSRIAAPKTTSVLAALASCGPVTRQFRDRRWRSCFYDARERPTHSAAPRPSTVTVTVAPAASPSPAPLPAAEADRQTCRAWHAAGEQIHAASRAQSVIPKSRTVLDPAVLANAQWAGAVRTSAEFYRRAGDTLAAGITPGNTTVLGQAATSTADALRTLSTAFGTFVAVGGNANHVMDEAAREVDVLCERLAPR